MIPRTLFTSYSCAGDPLIDEILAGWRAANPGFKVLYFSDAQIADFFATTPWKTTHGSMRNGVAIADFFRACYLFTNGGYWFDLDLSPISVTPIESKLHFFDMGFANISYMLIGAAPNHPLFAKVIARVQSNIARNVPIMRQPVIDVTGPRNIQSLIAERLGRSATDGWLRGNSEPQVYLAGSDWEFTYCRQAPKSVKSSAYQSLQKRHNKPPYYQLKYI